MYLCHPNTINEGMYEKVRLLFDIGLSAIAVRGKRAAGEDD